MERMAKPSKHNSRASFSARFVSSLFAGLFVVSFVIPTFTFAQTGLMVKPKMVKPEMVEPEMVKPKSRPNDGIQFSNPVESIWEFGLKINSTGNTRGIVATVPVPMDWPEQEIEIIHEERTANVSKFRMSNPTKHSRQFQFKIGQMSGNQPEIAYIRFKVKKQMIGAPKKLTDLKIPAKPSSKVRTFLKPSMFIESNHKRIKAIAKDLRNEKLSGWDQVEKNYRWVREEIQYKFDKVNRSCLEALDSKQGDCGELSSLFIAICRAQGIPARAIWIPDHTYPEFYLEDGSGKGHWFPCQAAGSFQFGAMTEARPVLAKGDRFRIPGEKKEVRFLRPTLMAKIPDGRISMEWISRQVKAEEKIKAQK